MIQTCGEVKHQETTLRRFHTDANFQQGEKWHVCGLESAETVARLSIRQAHTHTHTHVFSSCQKSPTTADPPFDTSFLRFTLFFSLVDLHV